MALQHEVEDETDGSPKNEDAIKDEIELSDYSQVPSPREKEYYSTKMQKTLEKIEAALKTSTQGLWDFQKDVKKLRYKATEQVETNHKMKNALEGLYHKMTCMEKRHAMHTALKWDFGRMLNVDIDTYRDRIAVGNMRSFMILRMNQIEKEFKSCMSWKTYLKKMWYKILGKSLAWEIVVTETVKALDYDKKKKNDSLTFLKSEEGWGKDFAVNMQKLLAQPW